MKQRLNMHKQFRNSLSISESRKVVGLRLLNCFYPLFAFKQFFVVFINHSPFYVKYRDFFYIYLMHGSILPLYLVFANVIYYFSKMFELRLVHSERWIIT